MSAFETLTKYWSSVDSDLVKLIAATPWASMREQDPDKLDHLYEKDDEQLEKGKRGDKYWDDPYAMATAIAQKQGYAVGDRKETGEAPPWGQGDFAHAGEGAKVRDRYARAIISGKGKKKKKKSVTKMMTKAQETRDLEKLSPGLEQLIAFGAGWALSGDVVNRDVPPELVREWERAINRQASDEERRKIERKIKNRLRKSNDDVLEPLNEYFLNKDHAPVPPRIGLMWDAVKHRWTRPERIGRTVWELSGHKRIRGTGTGAHERHVKVGGIGGRGAGSAEAGRRFKSTGDSGKLHPHEGGKKIGSKGEQKHPAFRGLAAFKKYPVKKKK